jgi:hypothetical protein
MTAYPGFSYSDAYNLSVSFRKWFIKQYNKRQESSRTSQDVNVPLTDKQKQKIIQQNQQHSKDPSRMSNFMKSSKK